MANIKVNLHGMDDIRKSVKKIKSKTSDLISDLKRAKRNLDWRVKSKSNIEGRISSLQRRIETQENKLEAYMRIIDNAANDFENKDRMLSRETKNIVYSLKACQFTAVSKVRSNSAYGSSIINSSENVNSIFNANKSTSTSLGNLRV